MTKRLEIYKCEICGNIVEVLHEGRGQLVCCGQPMKAMQENTVDASKEKHVPVVERTGDGILVKVGSAPHPMEKTHYIEWVQIVSGSNSWRVFLSPMGKPEGLFKIDPKGMPTITAREYCNIHGLWRS
ncbi:MAG: desulfoferrodoxin [bacterium]